LFGALQKAYPDAHCELNYSTPTELLIATILSAQSTDVGVNKATPGLFKAFPTPGDYAQATPQAIEPLISSIGLYRNKARAIHESMKRIHELHDDQVPDTMEELLELRGVARKTANVVLGNAYGINVGVVVDTHVARLAQRFDLSRHTKPGPIEKDLMAIFPRPKWTLLSHLLVFHGRRVCKARGGTCRDNPICQTYGSCSQD
jgi:endonuclease-3